MHNDLFSKSEFFDQLAVTLEVLLAEIGQQTFSFANQLHQPAVRRKILFVRLQMFGDTIDPLRQQGDLSFCRTRVGGFPTKFRKEIRFLLFCNIRHQKNFKNQPKNYSAY